MAEDVWHRSGTGIGAFTVVVISDILVSSAYRRSPLLYRSERPPDNLVGYSEPLESIGRRMLLSDGIPVITLSRPSGRCKHSEKP